jgi:predicted Zn-dependent protease
MVLKDMSVHLTAEHCARNRIKPRCIRSVLCVGLSVAALSLPNHVAAQDASVDRLIKKLPPPEKVAQTDPASRDPLAKKTVDAIKAMNLGNAYQLSKQLVARYPKSVGANSLHGQLALVLKRYPEASDAFHKAVAIQPNFAFGYVGLALSDASQNHLNAAMSDFREVTRLYPNAEVGWIGLSACAEKLGKKNDSVQYARHATAVAPSSLSAWLQLSRAEGISGNKQASATALKRANELRRKMGKTNQR